MGMSAARGIGAYKKAMGKVEELRKVSGCEMMIKKSNIESFIQNIQTDVYKVCLAILRLYYDGKMRSVVDETVPESKSALVKLRDEVGVEFAKIILRGLSGNPDSRPTLKEIYRCFYEHYKK